MHCKRRIFLELGADPQRTTVFIFTYPVNDLQTAAAALRQAAANRPMNALLAPGEASDILEKLLSGAGSELRTVRTPFVAQKDFDKLLWASDAAIIRGEDSFIRAQLAGLPMLWSTYPTEDHAHRVKLDAWLTRFVPKLAPWRLSPSYTKLAQDWLEGSAASEDICRFLLEARRYAPDLTSGAESSSSEVIWHGICLNVQNWACETAIYSESHSPEISKQR